MIEVLQQATENILGIDLEFLSELDAQYFRDRLALVRREQPEYSNLTVLVKGNHLWVIKKVVEEEIGDAD